MTRFDADSSFGRVRGHDATIVSARSTVARAPGIVVIATVLAGLAIALASTLLLAAQGARLQIDRTIDALQLSVFLQPQVGRSDAEALRDRIAAVPTVGSARLRTREEAIGALVAGGLPALSTKPNPLPDVWIVTLARPAGEAASSVSTRVATARAALEAMPGVESVRIDTRWAEWLDRVEVSVGRGVVVAGWVIPTALLVSLLGLFFLTGRGLSAGLSRELERTQAFATVGMIAGLAALVVAGGLLASVTAVVPESRAVWKPIVDSAGRTGHAFVVAVGLAVVIVAAAGHALGGSRR